MNCGNCDFQTKCSEILVAHATEKHKKCLKCNQTFIFQIDLLIHMEIVHDEEVQCNKCDFKVDIS